MQLASTSILERRKRGLRFSYSGSNVLWFVYSFMNNRRSFGNFSKCANSILISSSSAHPTYPSSVSTEIILGLKTENLFHTNLIEVAKPELTSDEIYHIINKQLGEYDFINLDFKGNLGHSIEKNKDDRNYIEKGNNLRLSDVELFTLEPHIQKIGGLFGYKMENINYFHGNNLVEL